VAIAMALDALPDAGEGAGRRGVRDARRAARRPPATLLRGDEIVSVLVPRRDPPMVEAEDIDLRVIYEDDDLAAIDKPPA
jgi:23S rRNA-/tRNA-specific pseudouridylate synthase